MNAKVHDKNDLMKMGGVNFCLGSGNYKLSTHRVQRVIHYQKT